MELKLNKEEVEQVLLDFARTLLDTTFNKVKADTYYSIGGVTFSYEAPSEEETQAMVKRIQDSNGVSL